MNGPEHFIEAERILAFSEARSEGELDLAVADAAAAQVHAILALAAAIAEGGPARMIYEFVGGEGGNRPNAWLEAIS